MFILVLRISPTDFATFKKYNYNQMFWSRGLCPTFLYFCHLSSVAPADPSANKDSAWWHSICKSHRARTRHIFCFLCCGESSAVFITILPACGGKWRTLKENKPNPPAGSSPTCERTLELWKRDGRYRPGYSRFTSNLYLLSKCTVAGIPVSNT